MSQRLLGVRAKIERAKSHIHDLDKRIKAFLETSPYTVVANKDSQTGDYVFHARISGIMDINIPIIAGESVHQLRSALDHLAYQLVEANGNVPSKNTYFPIAESVAKYKAQSPGQVKGMSTSAIAAIDAIKPYGGGDGNDLWRLHKLNNFDKHRLLFIVGYGMTRIGVSYRPPQIDVMLATIPGLADFMRDPNAVTDNMPTKGIMILEDNTEIMRLGNMPDIDINKNLKIVYSVAFGKPEIVDGEPVVPFLHQLTHLVDSIVSQFSPFV